MSPRAAWRLESLGFTDIYEYSAGKADWLAAGLPSEGHNRELRAKDALRTSAATCHFGARLRDIGSGSSGVPACVVTNEQGIVLGMLRGRRLQQDADVLVEEAMQEGPATFRADVPLTELVERMRRSNVKIVPITDPDGRLLGVLERETAERLIDEARQQGET